jgi:hypothetical protein
MRQSILKNSVKMKTIGMIFFGCLLNLILVPDTQAQISGDTTRIYRVITSDGNEFLGKIMSESATEIRLKTDKLGEIVLKKADMKNISVVNQNQMKNGIYWQENTQSSRYFFAPNGYGLKENEGYYQNVWVWYNQASFGITDNFSMGVGIIPLFMFAGTATPVWVIPKFSFPLVKDKFNLGVGAIVGTILGETTDAAGLVFGTTTFGSRDHNLSLGLGYGFIGKNWANTPLFDISGMTRISPKTYLLSENYFIVVNNEGFGMLSFGARSLIKRVGLDYGAFIPFGSGLNELIAIPWLGVTIPFGKNAGVSLKK